MLQLKEPSDLVLSTGLRHRVRDWLEIAFGSLGLDWKRYVRQDDRFLRKADPSQLVGDSSKAQALIGWTPSLDFQDLVAEMVQADMQQESGKLRNS